MKKFGNFLFTYLKLTVGAVIYAVSVALFLEPCVIIPGGVSGVSILLNHFFGFPTGVLILIINIPILILGLIFLGRKFLVRTIYATVISSVMIDVIKFLMRNAQPLVADKMLASIAGAVVMGVGCGIMMLSEGSTGGTEIIAKLLRRPFPQLKTGVLLFITDAVIVAVSAILLKDMENAIYDAITIFITAKIIDLMLYGKDEAKLLIIMSNRSEALCSELLEKLDVGVTLADGQGGYTGDPKKIIICVVKKQALHKAKKLVRELDDTAFMVVTSASEIYGEGYKKYGTVEL